MVKPQVIRFPLMEMLLVLGVFLYQFDWRYGFVLIATLAAYFAYTTYATNWRIAIRRQMNESDTDANQKAIDSLLNYETVKYFGAEEREATRYDKSMIHYEKASTHSYVSLAVLNAGFEAPQKIARRRTADAGAALRIVHGAMGSTNQV